MSRPWRLTKRRPYRTLTTTTACVLLASGLIAAAAAAAGPSATTPDIQQVYLPRGIFALEATPQRILIATMKPDATARSYLRLETHSWRGAGFLPLSFRLFCGEIQISEEGFPAFSLDEAGGLVALSGTSRIEHYVHGGVALAGSRQGNAICAEFDKGTFGEVHSSGRQLLETLPPRRECLDGTRARSCPVITPIISLNTRRRVAIAQGAFTLLAASGNLVVGQVSTRDRLTPHLLALDLASGNVRWTRPITDLAGPTGEDATLFGATDGTQVALAYGETLFFLDAMTGRSQRAWHNVHFALPELGLSGGFVAWISTSHPQGDAGGLVYVRDAAGRSRARPLATLPPDMYPVDIRLTSTGLAWAATRIVANNDPTRGGWLWIAPISTLRHALSRR